MTCFTHILENIVLACFVIQNYHTIYLDNFILCVAFLKQFLQQLILKFHMIWPCVANLTGAHECYRHSQLYVAFIIGDFVAYEATTFPTHRNIYSDILVCYPGTRDLETVDMPFINMLVNVYSFNPSASDIVYIMNICIIVYHNITIANVNV